MQWRQVSARRRSVGPARRAVVAFARRFGFSEQELHDVAIGVGEAIAYLAERAGRKGGYLEVSYRIVGGSLEIEVQDSGFRFERGPSEETPRTDLERGVSVQMMYRAMDHVDIGHNGTRVLLEKRRLPSTESPTMPHRRTSLKLVEPWEPADDPID